MRISFQAGIGDAGRRRLLAAIVSSLTTAAASAAPFTPGNIVVFQTGDGVTTLAAVGHPVVLKEYTPAGLLVQTLPMPTARIGSNYAFIDSGTANGDGGQVSRSIDGKCLILPGYGRDMTYNATTGAYTNSGTGNAGGTGTTDGTTLVPRILAVVGQGGAIDTTTALTDLALTSAGLQIRGVASADCTHLYVANGNSTGTTGTATGVRYTTLGATTTANLTSSTLYQAYGLGIFGSQLYTSTYSEAGYLGVDAVGTGLATAGSGNIAVTRLPGLTDTLTPKTFGFFFAHLNPSLSGVDTLYVADQSLEGSATTGTVRKFSLVGGSWVNNGDLVTVGSRSYRGITGTVANGVVTLYATSAAANFTAHQLVKLTDMTGYNGSVTAQTPTVLATPGLVLPNGTTSTSNLVFRGVALAPDPSVSTATWSMTVSGSSGVNGASISPSSTTVNQGGFAVFTITPNTAGYLPQVGGTCVGNLVGNTYTVSALTADCTVTASAAAPPGFLVAASASAPPNVAGAAHGTISPASSNIVQGQTAKLTVTPAAGYVAVMRGTCGGVLTGSTYTTKPITAACTVSAIFARKSVLFVGNSFTYGNIDLDGAFYNNTNITSLVPSTDTPPGATSPQPWGGLAGIFKKITDEVGLEYDVSLTAAPGIPLRTHYLNLYNGWDLLGNIASQKWTTVIMQSRSDEPIPDTRSTGNQAFFNTYADKLERYIHTGLAESYTETNVVGNGNAATCAALEKNTQADCNLLRVIPANPNANAGTDVYLYSTWPRPDETNLGTGSVYPDAGIATMAQDLHNTYFARFSANGKFKAVDPVGDAFMNAITYGYAAPNSYQPGNLLDLWGPDNYHASRAGYYLSALIHFGMITGLSPMIGYSANGAAAGLGLASADALNLQRVAYSTILPFKPTVTALTAGDGQVGVAFTAPNNVGRLPLLGYTVTAVGTAQTCTVAAPATACTVAGLTDGVAYTFTVAARNVIGLGWSSAVSAAAVPRAPRGTPVRPPVTTSR